MLPLRDGITILLKLLRENGKVHHFTTHGSFQQMQGGRVAQMLRISLDNTLPCIPEISANKYALNIRFIEANFTARTTLYDKDVAFNLTFCSLQSANRLSSPAPTAAKNMFGTPITVSVHSAANAANSSIWGNGRTRNIASNNANKTKRTKPLFRFQFKAETRR